MLVEEPTKLNNQGRWLANYEALKDHVADTGHFPNKHSRLNNWVRYQRKCIKAGTLEDWKREMFEELAASRSDSHTGGRKKTRSVAESNDKCTDL